MNRATLRNVIAAIDMRLESDPSGDAITYARRMSATLAELRRKPSPELEIAVRAQHFERWKYPRAEFPQGRAGYLQWRKTAAARQAEELTKLLETHELTAASIARCQALVTKRNLRSDAEAQLLEDCACLVFLQYELSEFAAKRGDGDELKRILRQTLKKMSARARVRIAETNIRREDPMVNGALEEALRDS